MKSFLGKKNFEKGALSYISTLFTTSEQRQELENLFNQIDINKDGKLSLEEFTYAFDHYFKENFSKQQIKDIFYSIDTDNSKYIGFQEFITAALDAHQLMTIENLEIIFKQIDKDNSGTISISELRNASAFLKRGSEDFINLLIQNLQLREDEVIPYKDFMNLLSKSIKDKSQKLNVSPNSNKSPLSNSQNSHSLSNLKVLKKYEIIEPNSVEDVHQNRFKFSQKNQEIQVSSIKSTKLMDLKNEQSSILSAQTVSDNNTKRSANE